MRRAQLAHRLGVSNSAVTQFEQAEVAGSITLNTLAKVAAALDCRLVYAFVPRTTFEEAVNARAQQVARQMLARVGHTMALEDQALNQEYQQEMIDDLARDLVASLPRELWDDPA
jgi:predicted DNA-binding mobile mystery protein A